MAARTNLRIRTLMAMFQCSQNLWLHAKHRGVLKSEIGHQPMSVGKVGHLHYLACQGFWRGHNYWKFDLQLTGACRELTLNACGLPPFAAGACRCGLPLCPTLLQHRAQRRRPHLRIYIHYYPLIPSLYPSLPPLLCCWSERSSSASSRGS